MRDRLATLVLAVLLSSPASAHEGPPYPILVDEVVGPYTLSVWADPDVGIGTFFIFVDPPDGEELEGTRVEVVVQPVTGRLAESSLEAQFESRRDGDRYLAEVPFDRKEQWLVRFVLDGPQGAGDTTVEVEVTPPGLGAWDLLWFVMPFLAVGLLWLKAVLVRHRVNLSEAG